MHAGQKHRGSCLVRRSNPVKSKAAGTKPGAQMRYLPCLESTEGQSQFEEMKKKRDETDLAEPGFGVLTENMETGVKE